MKIGPSYFIPARSQAPNFTAELKATDEGKQVLATNMKYCINNQFPHLKSFNDNDEKSYDKFFEDFFNRLKEKFEDKTKEVDGTLLIEQGDKGRQDRAVLSFIPAEGKKWNDINPELMNTLEANILLPAKDEIDKETGKYEPQLGRLIGQLYAMEKASAQTGNFFNLLF